MNAQTILSLGLAIGMGLVGYAADGDAETKNKRSVYRVPEGAEEGLRVNGANRAKGANGAEVFVLAPDHVGVTYREQPDLFWYQSTKSPVEFELIVTEDGEAEPVLSISGKQPKQAGILRVNLAEHKVKLQKGVEYQWSVALVTDPKNRSLDTVASGYLTRQSPDAKMSTRLARKSRTQLVDVYADSGVWYDALETLSDMIDVRPKDVELREWRADLLDQVGLPEPADFDRALVKKLSK